MPVDRSSAAGDDAARRARLDRYELLPALSRMTSAEIGLRARADMQEALAGNADSGNRNVLMVCGLALRQKEDLP